MSANQQVIVGTVIKPHGIKGEVAVGISNDSPELFRTGRTFVLRREKGPERVLEIAAVRFHQGRALISFRGIHDRSAAEQLRRYDLYIPAADLPATESDEFYHFEVLDSQVVDESGRRIGRVSAILETGPAVLLDIETPGGSFYLPFVAEYIAQVRRAEKELVIRNFHPLMTLDAE